MRARTEKREVLRDGVADEVLDHHSPDLVERVLDLTAGEGPTIVFEHVGQATWERSIEMAAHGGTIVTAGATSGDDARMNVTYMFVKQLRILGSRLGTMADTVDAARPPERRPLLASDRRGAAARGARRARTSCWTRVASPAR